MLGHSRARSSSFKVRLSRSSKRNCKELELCTCSWSLGSNVTDRKLGDICQQRKFRMHQAADIYIKPEVVVHINSELTPISVHSLDAYANYRSSR